MFFYMIYHMIYQFINWKPVHELRELFAFYFVQIYIYQVFVAK